MRRFLQRTTAWDVERPLRPGRLAGVSMAGFHIRELQAVRMVPHPAVTLILDFGTDSPVVDSSTGWQQRGSVVAGPGIGSAGSVWARGEHVECVQVRLSPVTARAVLRVSPAELAGGVVSLDDLWGREASRLCQRLGETASWQDRFAWTDRVLAGRQRQRAGASVEPEVARAWHRIIASQGLVRVDGLAREIGWSRKRLWSRFRSQLGLPPKRAAELVRFDHAAHRLVAGGDAARVAADGGYADQSHLHREVMAFAGVTPREVAGEPFLAVDDIAWPRQRGSTGSGARSRT